MTQKMAQCHVSNITDIRFYLIRKRIQYSLFNYDFLLLHYLKNATQTSSPFFFFLRSTEVALVVKNLPANAGYVRDAVRSLSWEEPWRRAWQSTPVFLPGEPPGKRSLVGYSPQGCTESNIPEATQHVRKEKTILIDTKNTIQDKNQVYTIFKPMQFSIK